MTNFQSDFNKNSSFSLTPESVLIFLPAFFGTVFAIVFFVAIIRPGWQFVQKRASEVEVLRTKSNRLPALRASLPGHLDRLTVLQKQEKWLLAFLAGTRDLNTFLAKLNGLAIRNEVSVVMTEPGEIVQFAPVLNSVIEPSSPNNSMDSMAAPSMAAPSMSQSSMNGLNTEDGMPIDPLLKEGLEKRFADVVVEGRFKGVLSFLQDLENLDTFVIIRDLNLKRSATDSTQSNDESEVIDVGLSLNLLVYGRIPLINSTPALEQGPLLISP